MSNPATPSLDRLIGQLLDRDYQRAADATLTAVARTLDDPMINQRLEELTAEAERLDGDQKKMTPDNAVLRALLADLEPVLERAARQVDRGGTTMQDSAVQTGATATRALALPGMNDRALRAIGIVWNVPNPEFVNQAVNYIDRPAWADEIKKYPGLTLGILTNQALRGMAEGWGPRRVAGEIVSKAKLLPMAQATLLTRTLWQESYRTASALNQLANADILTEQIRVGTLDTRICLCCLALHGQRLPIGERIRDHHAGRCTSIAVVRGRDRAIETGPDWYFALDEADQQEIAGPGAWEALRKGTAQLRDFVQPYTDPVWGEMVRQASLSGALKKG